MKKYLVILFIFVSILSFGLDFIKPMEKYFISSSVGGRDFSSSFHKGVDLVGPPNSIVYSVEKGFVVHIEIHPIYGKMIIIKHDEGLFSLYAHLSTIFVYLNDPVIRGNEIGRQGNTGRSTGEHLHFEIFYDPQDALENIEIPLMFWEF